MASPQLMQHIKHIFLSEQGVAAALASLPEMEFLGLVAGAIIGSVIGMTVGRSFRNPNA